MATRAEIIASGDVILPLEVNPRYFFNIELESEVYTITIHWNEIDSSWIMDLLGVSNDVDYKGIKLVVGPNLLKPYAILELGGLFVVDGEDAGVDPIYDNIVTRYALYYVPKGSDAII